MSFNPDNPRREALIAMSGGVDSSVAAYLAIESGLDCIGVTMKLFDNEDAGVSRELDAKNFNFIAFDTPPSEFRASARVRHRQAEQPATVRVTGENTAHITFDEPQRAITTGQAVVVYDGDVVIGGGEIC
ncbi:MAG: aminomethyltransferase beta-barrel domain-containing protein [Oscillospiraceae bacterium]|nr:aminomethyltransferase beta-barrel domain-containing protein [Oscillospiraceae bacterium]